MIVMVGPTVRSILYVMFTHLLSRSVKLNPVSKKSTFAAVVVNVNGVTVVDL